MKRINARYLLALALLFVSALSPAATPDETAINALLMKTWHSSEQPLQLGPLVINGDHAIADWQQGERGGRALLAKSANVWTVTLCAGDALKSAAYLIEAGVPPAQAAALAAALAAAEKSLDEPALRRMASFDGALKHH